MYRLFSILPAFLSWSTLGAVVFFSWSAPAPTAIFIILFDVYWLCKTVYLSLHLRVAFRTMQKNMKKNWIGELDRMMQNEKRKTKNASHRPHQTTDDVPLAMNDWRDIYHLVILPVSTEPYEVVRESLEALDGAHYPKERIIVAMGAEERIPTSYDVVDRLHKEFGASFFRFFVTSHPRGREGEIPGKGSNETWIAKEVKKRIIDPAGIPYENILVSSFDADTRVGSEYFGALTHVFLTCSHRQRSSFQPVPLFINNIFVAPALARVIAFSSSFWHLMQQARPERLTTFSSHAIPFKALVEVGFWQTDIVSEDSRIFWQCFLHYNGDWRVVPLHYPVFMDANAAPSFRKTVVNLYRQQRRWGWGCENIPYILNGFLAAGGIRRRTKAYWLFHYIEGFHSWATNALIIFTLGWLPIVLGGPDFRVTLLSFNLPRITRAVMTGAMIGIVSSAFLSIMALPPRPAGVGKKRLVFHVAQWLLMPITLIVFGAFPALDAQTRLAWGGKWRLGFWITPKSRPKG